MGGSSKGGEASKFATNLVAGAFAGAVSRTLTAPLERVKVVLQVQAVAKVPESQRYKGIVDCLARLPKEQGVFAYWRGNGLNVFRIIPNSAIKFSTFRYYTSLAFPKGVDSYEGKERVVRNVLCGAMSGFSTIVAIYPLDLARTRISADTNGEYRGVKHMLRYTVAKQGLSGLYSGLPISLCGIMPYFAIMFATFDYFKMITVGHPYFDTTFGRFILGSCAGIFSQSVTYPFDTVRRQMQGLFANASRAAPQAGIEFACFDMFAALLVQKRSSDVENSFAKSLEKDGPKQASAAPVTRSVVRKMSARLCTEDAKTILSTFRSLERRNGTVTREDISKQLLESGYKESQVKIIMSYTEEDAPIDYTKFRKMCKDKQVLEMLDQNQSCE